MKWLENEGIRTIKTIAIIGLGVVGGSYAQAIRLSCGHRYKIIGIDTDELTLKKAKQLGWIDQGYKDGKEVLPQADLVIFSLYPVMIKIFILDHLSYFKEGALLTDATGVKKPCMEEVLPILPSHVDFVFGHPMAGREKSGIDYASAQVFQGANYLITPTPLNKKENIDFIESFMRSLGFGRVTQTTIDFHDEIISFTSQLTHAIAVSLINSDREGRETVRFIGDSYRDLTRIANINEKLWSELFIENAPNLLQSIEAFEKELTLMKAAIANKDKTSLEERFVEAGKRRVALEEADYSLKYKD